MEPSQSARKVVRFGVYEVDLAAGQLRKHGLRLRLQEQPFQVLAALLERPGEVVSREDLCRRLWGDGTNVDFEHGLAKWGDTDPAVSPDGRMIAFTRGASDASSEIYTLRLSEDLRPAGEPRRVTSLKARSMSPAWTPDGAGLIFSSNSGGAFHLWRTGVAGTPAPRLLAEAGPDAFAPATGPRGRIAYSHLEADVNIWRQELPRRPGAAPVPVSLISSTALDGSPQYSRDGSRIAFQSGRSGSPEIWVSGGDGKQCRQLTATGGRHTGSPRWSPDATKIAFDSTAGGTFDIYVVAASGGRPRRVTSGSAMNAMPVWSEDGKWIYFQSNRTGRHEVWKIPSEGGDAVQITRNGGFTAMESRDGRSLYFTKSANHSSLWRSKPDGSDEEEVAARVFGRCFDVTADSIYFIRREESGEAALRVYKIATGKESRVATATLPPHAPNEMGLSVSPDGRYVLYARVDRHAGDLMLLENFR